MSPVPSLCPAAAPKAGTARYQAEGDGTGKAKADGELRGNGASCFKLFTHRH
jgi:hypothetical protein